MLLPTLMGSSNNISFNQNSLPIKTLLIPTRKIITSFVLLCFLVSGNTTPWYTAQAQQAVTLPAADSRLSLSPSFTPPLLKGIKVYKDEPFRFDFILDKGDFDKQGTTGADLNTNNARQISLQADSSRMIKYFLAALTVPEQDLWVNLSPYEKNRIVTDAFGQTEMGRDLLAQDYILKQLTASVIYPDNSIGKDFWQKVYAESMRRYGTTDVPIDTFNKVWILPESATVYENRDTAFVVKSRLKVMLEEDYLAMEKTVESKDPNQQGNNKLGSDIVREIVLPILEKEVNEGKNFTQLRQVYHALILATWYKRKVKDSIIGQAYVATNKTDGIDIEDKNEKEKIWQQYVEAFKKGAYNLIREEYDPLTQTTIPRKYFSGGFTASEKIMNDVMSYTRARPTDAAMTGQALIVRTRMSPNDAAMIDRRSGKTDNPLLNKSRKASLWEMTAEEENAIITWLQPSSPAFLEDKTLLKKLFVFITWEYLLEPGRGIHIDWLKALQTKWGLATTKQLTNMLRWLRTSSIDVEKADENVLASFLKTYVDSYTQNPGWRDNFNYIPVPGLTVNQQLELITDNIQRMTQMVPGEMIQRQAVLKAPVEGTDYYIGFEYGLVESTHGLYLVLGETKPGQSPADKGVIFKVGLDTQGDVFRIVMLQGEEGKLREINEEIPERLGMHPGIALIYVALQLATDGKFSIQNRPDFNPPKEEFSKLLGVRRKYMPAIIHGDYYSFSPIEFRGQFTAERLVQAIAARNISVPEAATAMESLNLLLNSTDLHPFFPNVLLAPEERELLAQSATLTGADRVKVNRLILEAALPQECPRATVINVNINYSRFGLRKATGDFGYWQEIDHLTKVTLPGRLKQNNLQAESIKKLMGALKSLQFLPGESFQSEYNRTNPGNDLYSRAAAPAVTDLAQSVNYLKDIPLDFIGKLSNFNRATILITFEDTPIVLNTLKNLLPGEDVEKIGIAKVTVSEEAFTAWGDNKRVYKATAMLKDGRTIPFIVKLPNVEEDVGMTSLWAEWQWRRKINEIAPNNSLFPAEGDIQEITLANKSRGISHQVVVYTESFLNGPDFESLARTNLTIEEKNQAARAFIDWYVNLWLLTDGYLMPTERYKRNVMFEQSPGGKLNLSNMRSFDTGIFYQEMTFDELIAFIREEMRGDWREVGESTLAEVLKSYNIDTPEGLKSASDRFPRLRLDVYDENGQPTGEVATYKEIHAQGKFHEVLWLLILDDKGQIMLQKRPYGIQDHPGVWDVYGGHVQTGKPIAEEAARMVRNETGITSPVKLIPLTEQRAIKRTVTYKGFTENVFASVVVVQLTAEQMKELKPSPDVLDFESVPLSELPNRVSELEPSDNLRYLVTSADLLSRTAELVDQAQISNPGGIDLQPDRIALTTQNSGEAIVFNLDPVRLAKLKQATGLTPVIVNILPLDNLAQFLGPAK